MRATPPRRNPSGGCPYRFLWGACYPHRRTHHSQESQFLNLPFDALLKLRRKISFFVVIVEAGSPFTLRFTVDASLGFPGWRTRGWLPAACSPVRMYIHGAESSATAELAYKNGCDQNQKGSAAYRCCFSTRLSCAAGLGIKRLSRETCIKRSAKRCTGGCRRQCAP